MKLLSSTSTDAVIAEFLQAEFYQKEYDRDRDRFQEIVLNCDLDNPRENAARRALLFRRRARMWRELPPDTQWYVAQIEGEDLDRIRVFPRAQWRKISDGSFLLTHIADRIRCSSARGRHEQVISKVQLLRYRLLHAPYPNSVLLIGVDAHGPFTILEGNHRLAAALLISPQLLQTGFRVLCGISPRMGESCWYETNLSNLWRYFKNRIRYMPDREADVEYMLRSFEPEMAKAVRPFHVSAEAARTLSAAADAATQAPAVECVEHVSGRRS